jgi:hypothetical protein
MMRNMHVLRMVFHLIVKKNHVENVTGVGVRNEIWDERKAHHRKHMGRQMIDGTGSESQSDIHHRETDKRCKKPYVRLLRRQLDERSCP